MTKVDIYFERPENKFGVELNAESQRAWDYWQAREEEGVDEENAWQFFLDSLSNQVEDHILAYTTFDEVCEAE